MAFPGSKIKNPNKLKKQKFSPLAPGIKNKYQLRKSIQRRTEGEVRPKLRAVNEQGKAEGRAHAGRIKDLQGYYDYYGTKVQEAFTRAQEALNNVMSTQGSANTTSQQNLLAALESTRAGDLAQASTVGGVLPQGLGDESALAAAGVGNATLAQLANNQGMNTQAAAGRIALQGLGRTRALEAEEARYGGVRKGLQDKRTEIKEGIPAAREDARKAILDEELARASERGRQDIAKKSLKVEKRKTGIEEDAQAETERSNRAQESIAWAGIQAEKQKYQAEIAGATSAAEKEAAEARGDAYNRGVEIFQGYFDKTKAKSWNPKTLFRNLTLAVSPDVALKIMSHGPPKFKTFVQKRRGNYKPPELSGPPNPKTGKVGP